MLLEYGSLKLFSAKDHPHENRFYSEVQQRATRDLFYSISLQGHFYIYPHNIAKKFKVNVVTNLMKRDQLNSTNMGICLALGNKFTLYVRRPGSSARDNVGYWIHFNTSSV